jgi:hypothetical protein
MIFFKFRIIDDNKEIYVPGKYTQTLGASVGATQQTYKHDEY